MIFGFKLEAFIFEKSAAKRWNYDVIVDGLFITLSWFFLKQMLSLNPNLQIREETHNVVIQ